MLLIEVHFLIIDDQVLNTQSLILLVILSLRHLTKYVKQQTRTTRRMIHAGLKMMNKNNLEKVESPEFQGGLNLMLRARVRTSVDQRRTVRWPVPSCFRQIA